MELDRIVESYLSRYRSSDAPVWSTWKNDMAVRATSQRPVTALSPLEGVGLHRVLDNLRESSYQEVATTSFIADYLLSLGYRLQKDDPKQHETELVMVGSENPSTYFRVDVDAVSCGNRKYQHSCGHSVNMASILTVAKKLKESGVNDVGFIFQPAEEGPGNAIDGYVHPQGFGGGQYLRNKGIYEQIPRIISSHLDMDLQDDEVRITPGEATAAAYRFTIKLNGAPAHAALPWQGVNPLEATRETLVALHELNGEFKKIQAPNYGLVTPSQLHTAECELNSLSPHAEIRGISRISGVEPLSTFLEFMRQRNAHIELEAPPVINDPALAHIAMGVAKRHRYNVNEQPARFRDETAWAGQLERPWVENPEKYGKGCPSVLHFFTPGYNSTSGGLHSETFNPNVERAIATQVKMLEGIAKSIS